MADIFISHAREDRERAIALADTLTRRGWSVWWDGRMPVGMSYSDVIEQELAAARCVIVLWSKVSVKSQWVQNEAAEGVARGMLVPALIDDARIPLEFRRLHTANLTGGTGELEDLLSSIAALLIRPDASPSIPSTTAIHSPALTNSGYIAITATVILILISIAIWSKRDRSQGARDTAAATTAQATTTIASATTTTAQTTSTSAEGPQRMDREQSAALIVGVRRFSHDVTLAEVPYAVDDAIDLAYVLVLDERVRLITAHRVILAISGIPRKPESQHRLNTLMAAGVQVRSAGQADVLDALDKQARTAGKNGALFIAFATHGMTIDDHQYLLAERSVLRHPETAIAVSKIRDIASRSGAEQSLVFIDACRTRSGGAGRSAAFIDTVNTRAVELSAASPAEPRPEAKAQVVLSVAPGGFAYDDDARRNGVFTAAVIDGLQCGAETDEYGLVTIQTLARYVEQRLRTWIHKYRNESDTGATELTWVGP